VTQVARTVARTLSLNEDLAEACALAHDLGHTPFGHSGEKALNRILTGGEPAVALSPKAVAGVGAFKHNYQSVRVVDLLEKRYEEPGLNLTDETREGILKHTTWKRDFPFPVLDPEGLHLGSGCHLEGQAVGWADEIAQQAHDLEDGLGLVGIGKAEEIPLAREIVAELGARWREASDPAVQRALLIRGLIHHLVTDLIVASRAAIEKWLTARKVTTPEEFAAHRGKLPGSLVAPSREGEKRYLELKEFVYRHIIHSQAVSQHDSRAQLVVNRLFDAYAKNPRLLPDAVLARVAELSGLPFLREIPLKKVEAVIAGRWGEEPAVLRCIADHIAGMTDSYALGEYDALFAPYPRRPAGTPAG
jgi:dGTPase